MDQCGEECLVTFSPCPYGCASKACERHVSLRAGGLKVCGLELSLCCSAHSRYCGLSGTSASPFARGMFKTREKVRLQAR